MKHSSLSLITISAFLITGYFSSAYAQAERPLLITERFLVQRSDRELFDRRDYYSNKDRSKYALLWHKIISGAGINHTDPSTDSFTSRSCNYQSALTILEQIRNQLGKDNPYQKLWIANQDKVFSACDDRKNDAPTPPVTYDASSLPTRASSDYQYQLASWHFYKGEYEQALTLYDSLGTMNDSPMRPLAAYMSARTMSYMGQQANAYDKIESILTDDTLAPVHHLATNYRFILMYSVNQNSALHNPEMAQKHLRWLVDLIENVNPEESADIDQTFADYFDALEHLDRYFRPYDKESKRVDWWLQEDVHPSSPRMTAVKALAGELETVDWLQASWTYNVFDESWLWALHNKDNPYWQENQNIVEHAWSRWKSGDGLEWLETAIERVHPASPLTKDILAAAQPYLENPTPDETAEYKNCLFNIWGNSIRLYLSAQDYDHALTLVKDERFRQLETRRSRKRYTPINHQRILSLAVNWLVYTSEIDQARLFLAAALGHYPDDYKHWRTLLASSWQEVLDANAPTKNNFGYRENNSDILWQKILNALPAAEQFKIASTTNQYSIFKQHLSWAILTKAMLLKDKKNIDEYGKFAADQNLPIRNQILEFISSHDRYQYVGLMLRTPRLRPIPFTMNIVSSAKEENPSIIDVYNHNDNNWWCTYDFGKIQNEVYSAALIRPHSTGLLKLDNEEFSLYGENIKSLLAKHPYNKLIDQREIRELESIPNGPHYLSKMVINHNATKELKFWQMKKNNNEDAANLHYAVRSTRYGCERNGSHGEYSYKAYTILHNRYGNTLWARITPYWFSDNHF